MNPGIGPKDLLAALAIVLIFSLLTSILSGRIRIGIAAGAVMASLLLVAWLLWAVSKFLDHTTSPHETSLLPPGNSPPLPPNLRPFPERTATKRKAKARRKKSEPLLLEAYDNLTQSDAPPITFDASDPSLSPPRPAWMDAETGRVDNLYRTRITVGPWLSRAECEQELPEALRRAISSYADRLLGEGKGQSVDLPMAYIHEHVVRGEWEERRQQTIETMIYLHELLEFDRQANRMIEASYKQSLVAERLRRAAAGGGALLGLLTILFGYLKLDTLLRGNHSAGD